MAPRGGDPRPLIILYSADESNMRSLSIPSFQSFWWGRESEELALPVKFTDTNRGRSCSVAVLCECTLTSSRLPLIFEVRGELAVLWKRQDPVLSLRSSHLQLFLPGLFLSQIPACLVSFLHSSPNSDEFSSETLFNFFLKLLLLQITLCALVFTAERLPHRSEIQHGFWFIHVLFVLISRM